MVNKTKQMDSDIKICFVALGAYPLLAKKNLKNVTGPNVHQVILAKELIKYGFKITFISHGDRGAPVEYLNGIEIIKIHRGAYRLRILNVVLEVFRIWGAMSKANAHIYVHRGGAAGIVSPFCRLMNKKFVCQIASDAAVNRKTVTRKSGVFSRSIFSFGTFGNWLNIWQDMLDIKLADVITVQSEFQKKLLKKIGKNGLLIKTPFPLSERGMPEKANPGIVLWVGAMAEVKQPELFLKLAETVPEARFQMIGGYFPENKELYDKIKASSKRFSNLEFFGVIPFDEVNKYFSRASILVNTSMFEGFPHAFIQAWMNYTPVVSLNSDPDEIICRYKMGFYSKTFNQLVEDVKTLLKNEALRDEMGAKSRQYVEREHNITKIIRTYIELFENVLRS